MRATAVAAVLTIVSGLALAQDAQPTPRPTGTLLLEALPAEADIVVHTPDLPSLLASASKAGLGAAPAWRAAFDQQMQAWGTALAAPERLVSGGGALLDAADGEALLAAVDVKLPNMSRSRTRTWLFAMRTTQFEKTLRAALTDLFEGGLRAQFPGEARDEEIGGRRVVAMPGTLSTLYVLLQDGLVVACDHPLVLGLYLRGLAQGAPAASKAPQGTGMLALTVRYGTGALRWEGWVWNEVESLQWTATERLVASAEPSDVIVSVCARDTNDLPLLPVPLTTPPVMNAPSGSSPSVHSVGLAGDGKPFIGTTLGVGKPDRKCDGGASRLVWLRAYVEGKIALPFPAVDPAVLRGPYDSAAATAGDKAGEFVAWKAGDEPGRLRGPLGHGPVTFLTLRSIHDIAHGVAPGTTAAPAAIAPKPRPAVPLPPPSEPKDK